MKRKKRKRKKQDVQPPEFKPRISEPSIDMTPIAWKTRDLMHRPSYEVRAFHTRGFGGRQPKSPQPTDQSFGEAAMPSLGIRPSGYIPRSNMREVNGELERLKEERQALEAVAERIEAEQKKLVLIVARFNRAEEDTRARNKDLASKVEELNAKIESLDSMLKAFSTLTSRMEEILSHHQKLAAVMR